MPDTLKPCPFCGSKNVGIYETAYGNYLNVFKYVLCQTCNCRTKAYRDEKDAIAAWNRRPTDES